MRRWLERVSRKANARDFVGVCCELEARAGKATAERRLCSEAMK